MWRERERAILKESKGINHIMDIHTHIHASVNII